METFFFGGRLAASSVAGRTRIAAWIFGLCLLMFGHAAYAAGCQPQSITVNSGQTVVTDLSTCNATGISGYQTLPQHGLNDSRNNNSSGLVYYTNNGDGSPTDSFAVFDGDDNSVIPFTVTVLQAGLSITTASLPDAKIGNSYSQTLAAAGGSPPYTWSLTGGALPAGLTLSASGVISGTPRQAGSFNPVFTVTDGGNTSASRTIALGVAAPTMTITPGSLPSMVVGTAYSQALATSGGTAPYTYTLGGGTLPPGVTLSSSGNVAGTPTTPGTYSFSVRSTDSSSGTGAPFVVTQAYSVTADAPTVTVAPATLPNPVVGAAYSQAVTASGGTAPYTFAITAGALPAGLSLASNGTISGTPTASGTFNFTTTATDASGFTGNRAYTVTVGAPTIAIAPTTLPNAVAGQSYSSTITASGGTPAYSYAVTAGALPSGMSLSPTGVLSGTSTTAGTFNFTITATDSSTGAGAPFSGSRTYALTVVAPTVVVAPATLPNPTVGAAYSQALSASGGTAGYTFAITAGALPSGMTLSPGGVLSGTPTAAGTVNFTTTATDANGFTGSRAYTVTVAAPTIVIAPAALPNAAAGQSYSGTITASGGTPAYSYAVTAGSLPSGMSLSPMGVLSGTSNIAGTFNFTVTATDSSTGAGAPFTGSRTYALTVGAPTVVVAPATLPNPTAGAAYSQTLSASGGTAGYTFAITAGALPSGLTLSSAGVLSGTPTAAGTFNFTTTATDANAFTGSRAYTVTVAAPTIVIAPATLPNAAAGQSYSGTITASGGTPAYSYAVTAGALPSGMSLSPTGVLSGTSTVAGTFIFTVTATDSSTGTGAPFTGSRAYTLSVGAPTVIVTPGSLPNPTVGAAYAQTVLASGGTGGYTFSITAGALPPGLALAADGAISGTPTAAGVTNVSITAQDSNGFTGARAYTLTTAGPTLVLTPATQSAARVDQAYTASFSTTGGTAPYTYTATGRLPTGLSLDGNGTLSGTPTEAGSFPITIQVTDSSTGAGSPFSASVNVTITVDADPLVLSPASPALTASYGVSTSIAFTSSGGSAPRTLALVGALPNGMVFDAASGLLTGTPSVTGSFPFSVSVTDSSLVPVTTSRSYTLTIADVTVVITPATLPSGTVGSAYTGALAASGGAAPYTFAVSAGSLPPGLVLSAAGVLSGTPTQSGTVDFTLRAVDSLGTSGTQAYTVTIGDAAPVAVADSATTAANQPVNIAVIANDTGVITSVAVAAAPAHGTAVVDGTLVRYTPAADFFGTDSFTYTATGPGGISNAATVTVTVQAGALPVAVAQTVTVLAGQSVAVDATQGASGGPFTAATLVAPPAAGTATVSATTITYSAPADSDSTQRFSYTLTNAFGVSQPASVTVTVQPLPVAVALTATVGAGQSVQVDLTRTARGGPFTDAAVVSVSPAQAGTATLVKTASGYRLDFAAAAAFSGQAQVMYTLSNAYAVSQPAMLTITVTARPDPSKDAEVTGVLGAQVDATRRMAAGQISNFQQRLESLHGAAASRFNNGLTVSSGAGRQREPSERPGKGMAGGMADLDASTLAASPSSTGATTGGGGSADQVAFWTGGAVNFGATDRTAASSGVDFTTSGVSFGADKRVSSAVTLGAGAGYGHDASDIGRLGSRSTTTAYNVALYASIRPSDAMFIDTLVGYQWLDFDARRHVTANDNTVTGSRDGTQVFGSVAIGYEHDNGTVRLTPYGRLDVAHAQLDGYTEQGDTTYALNYRSQTVRTSTGALGLRTEFRLKRDFGTLVPRFRVEYQRDFEGASNALMSYADLLGGPLYRADVGNTARNHALLGFGLQAQLDSGLTLRAEYQALFDSGTHGNQTILLGVEKTF